MWKYQEHMDVSSLLSKKKPSFIFKHSNRCSISAVAFSRVQAFKNEIDKRYDVYLIDVVQNRPLSMQIAEITGVQHESPQVIVIHNGEMRYSASHLSIDVQNVLSLV